MPNKYFYSVYGPMMKKFLAYKRALGFKYDAAEYDCARLDRLALHRDEVSIGISKEWAAELCTRRSHETEKTRLNWIHFIGQFSIFLQDQGYRSVVPKPPAFRSTYAPHIFSKKEIKKFFRTSDNLIANGLPSSSAVFVIPTLFRLLYGTGIRVGEAFNLRCQDVNLKEKYLTLRDTKNGQDRMVPISDSLADVCRCYMKYRDSRPVPSNEKHFFINHSGHACNSGIAYAWFRRVLFATGIPHGGRSLGPRLHDLRHTFSVHSLATMSEGGVDLYHSLPVLSTYLGHKSVASTDKYVRLTAEMYPSLIKNVNKLCPFLFPEVYKPSYYETD